MRDLDKTPDNRDLLKDWWREGLLQTIRENMFNGLSDEAIEGLKKSEHYIDIWDCNFDEAVELLLEAKKKDPNCFIIFGYHKIDANTREEAFLQYYWLTPEQFDEAMGVSK